MNVNHKTLQLSRRDFLKLVGTSGAGLVLAVYLEACTPDTETPEVAPIAPVAATPTPHPPFTWEPNIKL